MDQDFFGKVGKESCGGPLCLDFLFEKEAEHCARLVQPLFRKRGLVARYQVAFAGRHFSRRKLKKSAIMVAE